MEQYIKQHETELLLLELATGVLLLAFHFGEILSRATKTRQWKATVEWWAQRRAAGGAGYPPRPFLFFAEVVPVVLAGLILNLACVAMWTRLPSILFLDTCGTALVAVLLGPWWAALTGLASNILTGVQYVNGMGNADFMPWASVNVVQGIVWGWASRLPRFQHYIASGTPNVLSHLKFLAAFGSLTSFAAAIPGVIIGGAGDYEKRLPQSLGELGGGSPSLLSEAFMSLHNTLCSAAVTHYGQDCPAPAAGALRYLETVLRMLPDKTLSISVGLVFARYAFPLFHRELLVRRPPFLKDGWLTPLLGAGGLTLSSYLIWGRASVPEPTPVVGTTLTLASCLGIGALDAVIRGPTRKELDHSRKQRLGRYLAASPRVHDFLRADLFGAVVTAVGTVSILFLAAVFFLAKASEFGTVGFHFIVTMTTVFTVVALVRNGIRQSLILYEEADTGTPSAAPTTTTPK